MGRIKTGAQLLARYTDFLIYIAENDFVEAPTQGCFCRWIAKQDDKISVKRAQDMVAKHIDKVKKEMTDLMADALSAGALKGKYNATITTLCLKNLCDWSDKQRAEGAASVNRWEELIHDIYTDYGKADDSNAQQVEL